jgi:hypothetical protein
VTIKGVEECEYSMVVDVEKDTFGDIMKKLGKSYVEGSLILNGENMTSTNNPRDVNAFTKGLRNNDTLSYIKNESISINIYLLSGKHLTVDVNLHECVAGGAFEVENKYRISEGLQSFVLNGKELNYKKTRSYYNVSQNVNNNVTLIIKGNTARNDLDMCRKDVARVYAKNNGGVWCMAEYQILLSMEVQKRNINIREAYDDL